MSIKRNCPYNPLSKQPLALVLAQVRFSPILAIEGYIPTIQDHLRKNGYPVYSIQQNFIFDVVPMGQTIINQWRFESASHDTIVLIDKEQILFQTSLYTRFEDFLGKFIDILKYIFYFTEHDKFGIVVRIGLRYVDQIRKQSEIDDIDSYLLPKFQSVGCSEYIDNRKQYSIVTVGSTKPANDFEGQLVIRVFRGEKGVDLPSDLLSSAPAKRNTVNPDEDIAIVDMDHYWIGSLEPDINITEIIEERFYKLHDTIINGFYNSVISKEGLKKWK